MVRLDTLADVEVLRSDGVAVVEFTGEHDIATRDAVVAMLKSLLTQTDLVIVDVSQAQFIDSSFINNLFIADGLAIRHGKRFGLQYSTTPSVRRALEITGVLDALDCATSRETALRSTD